MKPESSCTNGAITCLGERLCLPAGWAFRAVVLDADLVLTPHNGTARINEQSRSGR